MERRRRPRKRSEPAQSPGVVQTVGIHSASGAPPETGETLPFDIEDPLTPPVQLDLPIDARIPISYVEDLNLRLELYRRIAGITHPDALADMRRELEDRFGKDAETGSVPEEVENLLFQIRVKILAGRAGIDRIGRELDNLVLRSEALENMDRKTMERRLQLALGKLSADDNAFVPQDAARVGRRAIYLPLDDEGLWQSVTCAHTPDYGNQLKSVCLIARSTIDRYPTFIPHNFVG